MVVYARWVMKPNVLGIHLAGTEALTSSSGPLGRVQWPSWAQFR